MNVAARLRLVYFCYYGMVGAFMPFFAPYLRGLGFTGEQIGTIQMIPSVLSPVVATSWAAYADRHAGPARALALSTSWAALAALALPFAGTPAAVGAVFVAMSLGDRSVVPLVDSVTLEHCRSHPGTSYARIRLFGSLGFVVLALALGRILGARGARPADPLVPILLAALVAAYALAARRLPRTPAHPDRPGARDMLALLADRPLLVLLVACAVHWAACAPFHLLFGVFVRDRGLPPDVAGLGMATGVTAEIAVLVAFPRLEKRASLRTLFAVAFLGSAVRWVLLADAQGATAIVLLQLLHGLTFGLFWGCATAAMGALVPSRLRATGQALFTAVVFGAGNGLGYALSGAGYDRYGAVGPLYVRAAVVELALAVVMAVALGRRTFAARAPPAL